MAFKENENKTPAQQMQEFKNQKRNEGQSDAPRREDREEDDRGRRPRREEDRRNNDSDPWGFLGKFGAPLSAINGSALEKFSTPAKEFIEYYEKTFKEKYGLTLDILLAGQDQSRVRIESVIFCATRDVGGKVPETLAYTLFLPTSSNIGTQYTEGERGRGGMSFSAVASDAYDSNFKRNIEQFIVRDGRGKKGTITHIGAATVPSTFDLGKEENVRSMIQYAFNVLWYQFADMYDNINDFALVDLFPKRNGDDDDRRSRRDDEVILNSNVVFKPEESIDVFGLPHQHDISIEVSLGRRRRDKDRPRNALSLEENQTLAKLGANVDLVYLGEEDTGGRRGRNKFRGRRRGEEDATALYGLALNLTEITTEGRDVMAMQLTALANVPLLIKESILTQALLPVADEVRLRDPRALALEQPESFPADLITEHPSEDEWANLMEAILHEDSTYIFLHAPRTGVHSQLLTYLVDACDEDSPTSDESYENITRTLNSLTDKHYGRLLGDDDIEFGTLEIRQSFSGYWSDDRSGERRDIAPIGYFNYLTRFGSQHPEYLDIYTRCFDNDGDTDEISARNEELLSAYTSKGYTIIDRNDVVRINPNWLSLIADALRDSGVSIDAEGIHTERGRRRPMSTQYSTGDMKSSLFRRGRRDRDRGYRGGRR